MGKLILEIEGVDLSQYFVHFTASPSGPGTIGTAELHIEKEAGGLDILIGQEVKLYFAFNAAGAGVQARGRIFGGIVAQRTEGNYGDQKTWVIACQDYNALARSIAQPAASVSEIVLSAGSFAAQIQFVTEKLQEQGLGTTNVGGRIDSVTHVVDLNPTMPADVLSAGKDLGWYYDYLCQTAQRLDPDLRPRWFLGPDATTFGVSEVFGNVTLHVYDAAIFGTAAFTHDESNIFTSHSRTTGRGNMLVQKLEAMYAHHSGQSQVASYTETAAATTYPNKWQNHDLTDDKGYWTAAAIEDSQSVNFPQAEAALKRKVQPLAYPSDTFEYYTMDWVKPGDVIDYSWALSGHANEQLRCVGVAVELENPDKLVSRITLNTRRLTLFDSGEEFYAPPVEGDVIPPAAPASVTLDYNHFNELIGLTELTYSWPASTSADTGGYKVNLVVNGGLAGWVDAGDALEYSTSVIPGATIDFYVKAYDTHNNVSLDTATVSGTAAAAVFPTLPNPSFEQPDFIDATKPRWWVLAPGNGTITWDNTTASDGTRSIKFQWAAGATAPKITSPFILVSDQNVRWISAAAKASTTDTDGIGFQVTWYDSAFGALGTTTGGFSNLTASWVQNVAIGGITPAADARYAKIDFLWNGAASGVSKWLDMVNYAEALPTVGYRDASVTNAKLKLWIPDSDPMLLKDIAGVTRGQLYYEDGSPLEIVLKSVSTGGVDPNLLLKGALGGYLRIAAGGVMGSNSTSVNALKVIGASGQTSTPLVSIDPFATGTNTGYNAIRFPAIAGNAGSGNFNITRATTDFAVGQPPDEVLSISYNQDTSGNRVLSGESGIGLWLEGHYEPVSGTEYTEFQLRYTTPANVQQRPIEIRINKNTNEVIHAINVSEFWMQSKDGGFIFADYLPTRVRWYLNGAGTGGDGVQFTEASDTFSFDPLGGGTRTLSMSSWTNALLPQLNLYNVYIEPLQHIYFSTDNTKDIGQASSTRPRDVHVGRDVKAGRHVTVANTLTVAGTVSISDDGNGHLADSTSGRTLVFDNWGYMYGSRFYATTALMTDGNVQVDGVQVVSNRGAAVADATGAGDVVAQLNALLARVRAHGLIA